MLSTHPDPARSIHPAARPLAFPVFAAPNALIASAPVTAPARAIAAAAHITGPPTAAIPAIASRPVLATCATLSIALATCATLPIPV